MSLALVSYVGLSCLGVCAVKLFVNGAKCCSKARIDGKVVIVTGANSGIGKETATELAKRGGKVYIACRSLERARAAVEDIKRAARVDDDRLPIMQLDLGSLESVCKFAQEFKLREKKLDILVNNAGVALVPRGRTRDGFETTFGVNHLGPFLLTILLLDRLMSADGGAGRIVNVASRAHKRATLYLDDLMSERSYWSWIAYCRSKMANILFTRELARRLGTTVSVYAVHPGLVQTDLFRSMPYIPGIRLLRSLLSALVWPFMKDPWHGAQTSLYCAIDQSIAAETGKYYSECAETQPAAQARDDVTARQLWDISVQLVDLKLSEIPELLL